jgi:hypothetical protein
MSDVMGIFAWGALGSFSVEVFKLYKKENLRLLIGLPRWELFSYVIVRAAGSLIAGAIAMAHGDRRPLISLAIGASARLIVLTMGKLTPSLLAGIRRAIKSDVCMGELSFQQ